MKRKGLIAIVLVLMLAMVTATSCDNRSQIEKDADKAMKKLDSKINN